VVYLTLSNPGPDDDRLMEARSELCARVELHRTTIQDGRARMEPVLGGVPLPAGSELELAPGGLHLMLMGLDRGLQVGDRVPLELEFEHAPPVVVASEVRAP
jgi:copper(I)-binding protein